MALKIRLQRHGASHRPFYRMVVTEAAARRDGRFVEVLGTYEPQASKPENELLLKLERIDYWKSVGAKPTDTAASLIRQARRGSVASASEKSKAEENAAVEAAATPAPEVAETAEEIVVEAPAEAEVETFAAAEGTEEAVTAETEAASATVEEASAEVGEAPAGPDCGCGNTEDLNGKCDGSHAKKDEPAAEVTEDQADAEEAKS